MKRKIIGISLFYLWIFQCVSPFLFYQIERIQCRQQNFSYRNTTLTNIQIEIFSLHKDAIHWEIEGKEFTMNGKLYDIISSVQSDNNIIIKCIPDKKEDRIVSNYQSGKDKSKHNNSVNKKNIAYE